MPPTPLRGRDSRISAPSSRGVYSSSGDASGPLTHPRLARLSQGSQEASHRRAAREVRIGGDSGSGGKPNGGKQFGGGQFGGGQFGGGQFGKGQYSPSRNRKTPPRARLSGDSTTALKGGGKGVHSKSRSSLSPSTPQRTNWSPPRSPPSGSGAGSSSTTRQFDSDLFTSSPADALTMGRIGPQQTILKLRRQLEETHLQATSAKSGLARSDAVILELRKAVRELRADVTRAEEERDGAIQAKGDSLKRAERLGRDLSVQRSVAAEKEREVIDLRSRLERTRREANGNEIVGELQLRLDRAHAQILTSDMKLKEREDAEDERSRETQRRLEAVEAGWREALDESRVECEGLKAELQRRNEVVSGVEEKARDLEAVLAESDKDLEISREQLKERDGVLDIAEELDARVLELEKEVRERDTKITKMKWRLKSCEEDRENPTERSRDKSSSGRSSTSAGRMRAELEEMTLNFGTAEMELANVKMTLHDTEKKIQEVLTERDELRDKLKRNENRDTERFERLATELESTKKEMMDQNEQHTVSDSKQSNMIKRMPQQVPEAKESDGALERHIGERVLMNGPPSESEQSCLSEYKCLVEEMEEQLDVAKEEVHKLRKRLSQQDKDRHRSPVDIRSEVVELRMKLAEHEAKLEGVEARERRLKAVYGAQKSLETRENRLNAVYKNQKLLEFQSLELTANRDILIKENKKQTEEIERLIKEKEAGLQHAEDLTQRAEKTEKEKEFLEEEKYFMRKS